MLKHSLLKVKIEYLDILSGEMDVVSTELSVERSEVNFPGVMPIRLDENLNRYSAAKVIIESIELSNRLQFSESQKKIKRMYINHQYISFWAFTFLSIINQRFRRLCKWYE